MKIEMKILNKEFYPADQMHETEYYRIPRYATTGSAAIDLVCTEDITIYPGETKMIPTGLAIWIGSSIMKPNLLMHSPDDGIGSIASYDPLSLAGLILPRSGLGTKGLILANTIGLIDEDYQGELMVSAWNRLESWDTHHTGKAIEHNKIYLKAGDRFAQLTFIPVIKAQFDIVEEFSDSTERGIGGFGHTGV